MNRINIIDKTREGYALPILLKRRIWRILQQPLNIRVICLGCLGSIEAQHDDSPGIQVCSEL